MKLRQLPEDFKVEEINKFELSSGRNSYKLYLLEKKGIETFSLLGYLSKKNNIPVSEFGIAGLKDRHAVTKQYFTVPSKYEIKTLRETNFTITFLGYVSKGIKLGDLECNKFEITVRDVKKGELQGIAQKSQNIELIGVPNYFDSQRFWSVADHQFIAKFLIQKNYEQAVKCFLTKYHKSEGRKTKEEKTAIHQNWGKESLLRLNVKTPQLANVLNEYRKRKSWLDAYKRISPSIREIIVSAYQSYLWNECIKKILIKLVNKKKLYSIKYNIGSLLFYKTIADEELRKIPLTFKTISDQIKPDSFELEIIDKVLGKEGVSVSGFNIKKETGNFFKTHDRLVIVKPKSFRISQPLADELNGRGNAFKFVLSFTLPKGSYATVITKRIFNQ